MSDNKLASHNAVPAAKSKGTWPTASTRLPPEESRLLDAAAYKLDVNRADVVYSGTMRFVRQVLGLPEAA